MKRYLIIGSRDLTEYVNGQYLPLMVETLRKKGHEVTVFLIENGVVAARGGSKAGRVLNSLADKGARVLAEDVSCRARGVTCLASGISMSSLDVLAEFISEGFDNVVWY